MSQRQIILDTETTGLNFRGGDRILEIGCIEMLNRRPTGNNFHRYINPGRDSDPGALAVHGLTTDFLADKPRFADIVEELHAYLADAEILIHNASFDVGFLDAEFALLDRPVFKQLCPVVIDTLAMAKEMHPGKRNSLDALCERYGVSNARRTLHGALLDAELLAEVYLAMTRGQESLMMDIEPMVQTNDQLCIMQNVLQNLIVVPASVEEEEQHTLWLAALQKEIRVEPVWYRLAEQAARDAAQATAQPAAS